MEFQYFGANCVSISTKQATIVVDDNLSDVGLKTVTKPEAIALFTSLHEASSPARLVFADPGEYEASGISVFGIAARAHMDEAGKTSATIFKLQHEDLRVVVL